MTVHITLSLVEVLAPAASGPAVLFSLTSAMAAGTMACVGATGLLRASVLATAATVTYLLGWIVAQEAVGRG